MLKHCLRTVQSWFKYKRNNWLAYSRKPSPRHSAATWHSTPSRDLVMPGTKQPGMNHVCIAHLCQEAMPLTQAKDTSCKNCNAIHYIFTESLVRIPQQRWGKNNHRTYIAKIQETRCNWHIYTYSTDQWIFFPSIRITKGWTKSIKMPATRCSYKEKWPLLR